MSCCAATFTVHWPFSLQAHRDKAVPGSQNCVCGWKCSVWALQPSPHFPPFKCSLGFDHRTLPLIRLLGPAFISVALLDCPCCAFVCLFYWFVTQITQKSGIEQRAGNSFRLRAGNCWNWKMWQSMQGCSHIKTALFSLFLEFFWGAFSKKEKEWKPKCRTKSAHKIQLVK